MPARNVTETRLAARFSVNYNRFRNPATGAVAWQLTVHAGVLDQNGELVRQIQVDDILPLLSASQRTGLQNLADLIVTKLSERLEVQPE